MSQRTKSGTFARHTKQTHKSQPCKRACLVPTLLGHTLLRWTKAFNSTHPDEGHTYNIGFGVIGAGRCYLHLQQHGSSCSGMTFFNLAFSCYLQLHIFNWALVTGGRFSNPPTTPSPARYAPCYERLRQKKSTNSNNFENKFLTSKS